VFEVQVFLDDLDPNGVQAELYADGANGDGPIRREMKCVRHLEGASGGYAYRAGVSATRPVADYTARLVPHYTGAAVPLEAARILWQR
jgi:starch phosphorylase